MADFNLLNLTENIRLVYLVLLIHCFPVNLGFSL